MKPEDTVDFRERCKALTQRCRKWLDSFTLAFMWRADLFTCMLVFFFFSLFLQKKQSIRLGLTHRHIPGDMAVWKVTSLLFLPSSLIYSRPHMDVLRQNPHNQTWNISVLRDLATGSRLAFASAGCHEPRTSWERLVPNSVQYAWVAQTNWLFSPLFSLMQCMHFLWGDRVGEG